MDKVYCTFCGEEYSAELSRCPECGEKNKNVAKASTEDDVAAFAPEEYDEGDTGGKRPRDPDKIPVWLKTLILIVAGVAIIIAALFMLYKMGMINFGRSGDDEVQTSLTLPVGDLESDAPSAAVSSSPEVSPSSSLAVQNPGESPAVSAEPSPAVSTEQTPVVSDPVESMPAVECNSITINRTDITFFSRGEVCNFNAMTEPSSAADYVVWSSSDPKVVKIDEGGTATAVNGGTAYITATCGDQTASCIVRCSFEVGEYLTMSNEDITMAAVGETAQLSVQDITTAEAAKLKWSSGDETVATVDDKGLVTAVSKGTVTISADLDGKVAECVVRVNIPSITAPDGTEITVTLNHSDVTLFTVGEYVQLKVEASDTSAVDTSSLTWVSKDDKVATVDGTGLVKAAGNGTTTVYTTVGGQTVSCIIRVSLQ